MPIILLIIALVALKYFEVWKFAELSWWWIVAVMGAAFIWFEFIEPMLGLDKRKAHNVDEQRRKDRVKKSFEDLRKRK
ncbi:TIGR04438 family Trp-rich protein [Pseudoduganella sp. DS3]|uniref:TIGR04438 family Trp-rich protein n=1 Tax=Pseudoduganella guangdongensis TaxID=2692179 RepID=A0A6N9HE38_9BURK|nr:TIGR04438 family Trp-rich protein [Pseudoduganella guangdongensis]MYN01716.1 TIGR04438 family Trp-rich protein [Pseudoduganella guangdongensis]